MFKPITFVVATSLNNEKKILETHFFVFVFNNSVNRLKELCYTYYLSIMKCRSMNMV